MMKKKESDSLALRRNSRIETTQQFSTLFTAAYPAALRYARFLCGDNDLGKDLVQIASTTAWVNFSRLRDMAQFKWWLFRIIQRAHLNHVRKQSRRSRLAPTIEDYQEELQYDGADDALSALHRQWELNDVLACIPVDRRNEWLLYAFVGMNVRELSEMQGCNIACMSKRLERTRRKLAEAVTAGTISEHSALGNSSAIDSLSEWADDYVRALRPGEHPIRTAQPMLESQHAQTW